MKKQLFIIIAGIIALAATTTGHADINLLERYPTQLTAGDANPQRARAFAFSSSDIFRLSHFSLEIGQDLKIAMGAADLGLGHTVDGAVWAVIIPRAEVAATLTSSATNQPEAAAHVWLRFHPREIHRLFPPDTVFPDGLTNQIRLMQIIVNAKFFSSWHAGTNATIPEPNVLTVDLDTQGGLRRFFMVDRIAGTAKYAAAFETRAVKQPPPLTPDAAKKSFNQLWESFDRDYAMFVLRPELDWTQLREDFYPKAMAATTTYEFADVCAEMLKPLRDLHVWMSVASASVPVFNRPRAPNSNPSAHAAILGKLNRDGRVAWTVTAGQIGYISISGWDTGPEIPKLCDQALEAMRNTRGLIIDVRLNGGGAEPTAMKVAGRFLPKEFVYGYHQYRNGPSHTNLSERNPRRVAPRGPWRYNRPVVLLIGQKCMSSNESFIGMMTGDPDLTTMGDHTCGSSGNPKMIRLPLDITVSLPRWIDYRPDGASLDERGFEPQVPFRPVLGAFEGQRDDLLTAALERLRQVPLPEKPIEGPAYSIEEMSGPAGLRRATEELPDHAAEVKEEAQDASRPKVVSVSPAADSQVPAGPTELRVRFDRPMEPLSLNLEWESGGFSNCEFPQYNPEKYEFAIPVRLPPGALHQIVVNKPAWGDAKLSERRKTAPHDGFQSTDHRLAGVFVWHFQTRALPPASPAQPATAVRITPASGSQVPLRTFLEIQFDQPMASPLEASPYLVVKRGPKAPQMVSHVEYDAARRTFRVPMLFAAKEKASFTLTGFRNAAGILAQPIPLEYQTSKEELAKAERTAWEAGAKEPKLLDLLESVRQKRTQITAMAERVQQLSLRQEDGLFTRLDAKSATFKWQDPGRFYGDVTELMGITDAFRTGCDGEKWWMHSANINRKKLIACPAKDINELNLTFGDPFGLSRQTPAIAAAELGLRHAGSQQHGGAEGPIVEAWTVYNLEGMTAHADLKQWSLDSQTGRVAEIRTYSVNNVWRTRFFYDAINQPLPKEAFAMPQIEGLAETPPDPLDAGYTNRFLIISDGSNGSISLRFGKQGPQGTRGGGLN